ncbi:MAG: hypothetical protein A3B04_02600 [Candidatus Portnoybacteria bacterium RIFCSPLOWO2_02_FULL_39_11]|uniref:HMA domain-containing protein n=1 Tax=Candidatus Portnoybacteria bacterium RIFCSPLOWO2_02_FULL_39_11 TaxID=1802001 RepID=A0A1G2FUG6_9BACT|nr:MAG: hypothetical protein A3B04_02600 [Candidatus Portnoybacteria bacterium RIFCSPLOWO2_02_FULL_39_11]
MTTKFKLSGLTCEACVKLATMRLKRLTGVKDVIIKLATGETEIIADHEISDKEAELVLAGSEYTIVKK